MSMRSIITKRAAEATGLKEGTPVAVGGGDGSCAGVGVGCIKPGTAYPATLKKVKAAYARARIVVPGHGDPGGPELIDHTLKLCNKSSAQ